MNSSNGRILKNTGLLYFRLIFLTLINFYAVRVTLEALGDIDYGIFDVIASVVASLSVLTGAMTSATQRFLSFHLGRSDYNEYSKTFTLLLLSFIGIAIILILIGEILGYFFIRDWLTIPKESFKAAYWVFQASLISFGFGLITIPYTSSIVANEKMDAFAIFSIVEGVLKLAIAFMLLHYGGDRLILYSFLIAAISIIVFLMSMQYCHSKFKYCRYLWKWDKDIFSQLSQYTGWNLFGSVSGMLTTQGQNILLNIYFGPIVNTSKAIADKIRNVINGFSVNLYMAINPQMVKSYATENYNRSISLVLLSSKFSFMLIFVMAFPLICSMNSILQCWLGANSKVPYMTAFSRLILVYTLILCLEPPLTSIIQATGNIKRYQLLVGAVTLTYIPITAFVLHLGASPITTLIILMAIMAIAQCVRVYVAHDQVGLSYLQYFRKVIVPILRVSIISLPIYWVVMEWRIPGFWTDLVIKTIISSTFGIAIVFLLGLDKKDKIMIKEYVRERITKKKLRS